MQQRYTKYFFSQRLSFFFIRNTFRMVFPLDTFNTSNIIFYEMNIIEQSIYFYSVINSVKTDTRIDLLRVKLC